MFEDIAGFAFYLGDDSGIEHSYVDSSVQNGRTYYYALVAYNTGNEVPQKYFRRKTKLIFPSLLKEW